MLTEDLITIEKAVELLQTNVEEWNAIRKANPNWYPYLYTSKITDSDLSELGTSPGDFLPKYLQTIQGLNLRGVNLSGVNFSHASLLNANLSECNLQGANLSHAKLHGANLQKADLTRADLSAAFLQKANLREVTLVEADMGNIMAPDSDFRRSNLIGADIRCALLFHSNFSNADLSGVDLRGTHLTDIHGVATDFTNSIFKHTVFSSEEDDQFGHLAAVKGLETAVFDNPQFLPTYLERAFDYVHKQRASERRMYPKLYEVILENIKYLRSLYTTEEPPSVLINVINVINTELISYLVKHPKALNNIQPRQFEELIAEILLSFGWEVQLTPPTKDGGYDIFAISKDTAGVKTSWIIECKRYAQERKVGVEIARSLYGVKLDLRVANAMLATTSRFTKGVQDFKASRYDFELRDYEGILEWINSYRPNPEGKLYIENNNLKVFK